MATKNLLRSMMEGPRNERGRREARARKRASRASARLALRRVARDPEAWESEGVVIADRRPVDVDFSLKHNAMVRWLLSHTGKPWSEVYSRLKARLGRLHFAMDAAMRRVYQVPGERNDYATAFCVGDGTVCVDIEPSNELCMSRVPREEILEWLSGRKVIARGQHYFWGEPTPFAVAHGKGYRQNKRFSASDIEFFGGLPKAIRTRIINGDYIPFSC